MCKKKHLKILKNSNGIKKFFLHTSRDEKSRGRYSIVRNKKVKFRYFLYKKTPFVKNE